MLATTTRIHPRFVSIVALALAFVVAFGAIAPAFAETAGQRSTRNIILGAVALTAGIILYNNYHHKQVAYNTVVGRTYDGGTVYADGRIVYPDGTVVYTSNNGRTPCNYAGYGEPCGTAAHGYAWRYAGTSEWHGRGRHLGHYKHHRGDHDRGDNDRGDHDRGDGGD